MIVCISVWVEVEGKRLGHRELSFDIAGAHAERARAMAWEAIRQTQTAVLTEIDTAVGQGLAEGGAS